MSNDKILVLRGRLDWAKITGKARKYTGNPKYDKGPEWTMDLTPDAASRAKLEAVLKKGKKSDKFREPYEKDTRTETYLSFRVLETKANGEKNDPPKIADDQGQPWDNRLIGNGSIADVKVRYVDYDGTEGLYLQAVRVLGHIPYEIEEFAPLSEDDEYFSAPEAVTEEESSEGAPEVSAETENLDDLDDEMPF